MLLSSSLSSPDGFDKASFFFDRNAVPAFLVSCDSSCSSSGKIIQYDVTWISEDLNQSANQEFGFFGWMVTLFITLLTDFVVENVFHLRLPKEVKGFRSIKCSAIVD